MPGSNPGCLACTLCSGFITVRHIHFLLHPLSLSQYLAFDIHVHALRFLCSVDYGHLRLSSVYQLLTSLDSSRSMVGFVTLASTSFVTALNVRAVFLLC